MASPAGAGPATTSARVGGWHTGHGGTTHALQGSELARRLSAEARPLLPWSGRGDHVPRPATVGRSRNVLTCCSRARWSSSTPGWSSAGSLASAGTSHSSWHVHRLFLRAALSPVPRAERHAHTRSINMAEDCSFVRLAEDGSVGLGGRRTRCFGPGWLVGPRAVARYERSWQLSATS